MLLFVFLGFLTQHSPIIHQTIHFLYLLYLHLGHRGLLEPVPAVKGPG